MFCSKCGQEITSNSKFCPSCGYSYAQGEYAGFWSRVAAALIDGLLLGAVTSPVWFLLGFLFDVRNPAGEAALSLLTNSLSVIVGICYYGLMESSVKQATVGKMVMGLKVADMDGNRITFIRAIGRYLAKYVSAAILLIGFLMVAFTDKKQGLHDKIVNTVVLKK